MTFFNEKRCQLVVTDILNCKLGIKMQIGIATVEINYSGAPQE